MWLAFLPCNDSLLLDCLARYWNTCPASRLNDDNSFVPRSVISTVVLLWQAATTKMKNNCNCTSRSSVVLYTSGQRWWLVGGNILSLLRVHSTLHYISPWQFFLIISDIIRSTCGLKTKLKQLTLVQKWIFFNSHNHHNHAQFRLAPICF